MIPALEIGGSHVTAALVDLSSGAVSRRVRNPLRGDASADELLDAIAATASSVEAPADAVWGVGIPGPFEYSAGIGRFHGVGKFGSLNGVDVGAALLARITPRPRAMRFLNDAWAFGVGEWQWGAGRGHSRVVALTLGTGIGSAFLDSGTPVTTGPDVPPEGRADLLRINGRPLEDVASTRALISAYHKATGTRCTDFAHLNTLATTGDQHATDIITHAYTHLGTTLAPYLHAFEATVLILGGGITTALPTINGPLSQTLPLPLVPCSDTEAAALRGAAHHAST